MQDIDPNQIKLKENDIYKKDAKITTKFEPSYPEDFINKRYLETKLPEVKGNKSQTEKDFIVIENFEISKEEALIQRAVKTTIRTLRDKGLFDNYDFADNV